MDHLIFVYGTLQAGHRNAHVNRGRRVGRTATTVQAFPLHIVGGGVPWLLNRPGHGLAVTGELYAVDDATLADMDRLERIDTPGWYERVRIAVQLDDEPAPREVWVYMGSEAGFARLQSLAGPLARYTLQLAQVHPFVYPAA